MIRDARLALAAGLFSAGMSLFSGQTAHAVGPPIEVRDISDAGVLILGKDRRVCLGGVWLGGLSPSRLQSGMLKQAMTELIGGEPVLIGGEAPPVFDRYGCELANVMTADGMSVQRGLLMRGLAMVRPSSWSSADQIDAWLDLEAKARRAKLGLWHDDASRPQKASAMTAHIGKTGLVEGRVVRIYENDRYVYLNFGSDWRSDFTVRLRQKLLKQSGVEPGRFDRQRLRIRGFVQEARGPLIDISHLKQIEIIP